MPFSRSSSKRKAIILSDVQRRMYAQEKEENFRWIYRLLASRHPDPLPSSSLADVALEYELAAIGQFVEVAHGSISPAFIWANLEKLLRDSYPLEGYTELRGSRLLGTYIGDVANLQSYIAHRPEQKQLVIAFSGTSSLRHVWHELNAFLKPYGNEIKSNATAKVHAGFWKLYAGVRDKVLSGVKDALQQLDDEVNEVIITGHSLGGAMASLLLLDLLQLHETDSSNWWSPHRLTLTLATFGSPRIGNVSFAQLYQSAKEAFCSRYGEDRLRDFTVKGYNDGVPCLPMNSLGYVHLPQTMLYLYHERLYNVPSPLREYAEFDIIGVDDENAPPPRFPLGGHNYYNNRDMARGLRRLWWIDMHSEQDWEEHYLSRMRRETRT